MGVRGKPLGSKQGVTGVGNGGRVFTVFHAEKSTELGGDPDLKLNGWGEGGKGLKRPETRKHDLFGGEIAEEESNRESEWAGIQSRKMQSSIAETEWRGVGGKQTAKRRPSFTLIGDQHTRRRPLFVHDRG